MRNSSQTTHQSPKKAFIIAGIAAAILLAGLATYVFAFNGNLFGWQPTKQTTSTQTSTDKAATPAKQETTETTGENTNNSTKNDTPETVAPTNTLVVTFTHWSTTGVGVLITGLVDGTCTLNLTKEGSETITMTAETFQSGSNTSTCRGFNYDQLPDGGWTATVTVKTSDATGSASKMIE